MTAANTPTLFRTGAAAAATAILLALGGPLGAAEVPQRFDGMLDAHNRVRAAVDVPPLEWSPALADDAQAWADTLKGRGCAMEHTPDTDHGQNLAWAAGRDLTPERVVEMWAREKRNYDHATDRCASGKACGHYTQMVWEDTRRVGCGMASCGREEVWVCDYDPPGNIIGRKPY